MLRWCSVPQDIFKQRTDIVICNRMNGVLRQRNVFLWIYTWYTYTDYSDTVILGMGSATERRRYNVTSPFVGWAQTQNNRQGPLYFCLHSNTYNETKMSCSRNFLQCLRMHYSDVIMRASASPITSLTIVYHLFRSRSKKTPKLRVTGLCEGNSPVIGEFRAQRASNSENVSIWWRHHVILSLWQLPM